MVLDPLLAQHLAHWGINMMQVQGRGGHSVGQGVGTATL